MPEKQQVHEPDISTGTHVSEKRLVQPKTYRTHVDCSEDDTDEYSTSSNSDSEAGVVWEDDPPDESSTHHKIKLPVGSSGPKTPTVTVERIDKGQNEDYRRITQEDIEKKTEDKQKPHENTDVKSSLDMSDVPGHKSKSVETAELIAKAEVVEDVNAVDESTPNPMSFLPSPEDLGALGKGRVSLARKAGVKGSVRRFRRRNERFNTLRHHTDDSESEPEATTSAITPVINETSVCETDMVEVSLTDDVLESSNGIDSESNDLSKSMEAMTTGPNKSSKVKGRYIKARISQYIQKLKESTRPRWKQENNSAKTLAKNISPRIAHAQTKSTDEILKPAEECEVSKRNIPVVNSRVGLSNGFEQQPLTVSDSMEIATWALSSRDHTLDIDVVIEQEIRRNKTTWKRVMEELRDKLQEAQGEEETRYIAGKATSVELEEAEEKPTQATVTNSNSENLSDQNFHYIGTCNNDLQHNVELVHEKQSTMDSKEINPDLNIDSKISTEDDAKSRLTTDFTKYSRLDGLETIQEEVIADIPVPNPIHFVIGVEHITVGGDDGIISTTTNTDILAEKVERQENRSDSSATDTFVHSNAQHSSITKGCGNSSGYKEAENINIGYSEAGMKDELKAAEPNEIDGRVLTTQDEDGVVVIETADEEPSEIEKHRYNPDPDVHQVRSDHAFLVAKLSYRKKVPRGYNITHSLVKFVYKSRLLTSTHISGT